HDFYVSENGQRERRWHVAPDKRWLKVKRGKNRFFSYDVEKTLFSSGQINIYPVNWLRGSLDSRIMNPSMFMHCDEVSMLWTPYVCGNCMSHDMEYTLKKSKPFRLLIEKTKEPIQTDYMPASEETPSKPSPEQTCL
ncbi:MAG: hypothetical protein V1887_00405, partial [Candidatus Aenigmatarchaeota archaeon]